MVLAHRLFSSPEFQECLFNCGDSLVAALLIAVSIKLLEVVCFVIVVILKGT